MMEAQSRSLGKEPVKERKARRLPALPVTVDTAILR
jgi:hypothetical protein